LGEYYSGIIEMKNSGIIHENVLSYADSKVPFVIKSTKEMRTIAAKPHSHSYYMILWSANSSGRHIIDQNEYILGPDKIYFIKPGQIHQIISSKSPSGTIMLFTPEFIMQNSLQKKFISDLELFNSPEGAFTLTTNLVSRLKKHTFDMMDAFNSTNRYKYETISAHLKLFLIECNEQYLLVSKNKAPDNASESTLMLAFKALVEEHFYEWRLVKNYSDKLNITSNYLSEVIKRTTGQPPKMHIQSRLVLEAKRLLLFTGRSAKEIGYELGFNDPARFSRFFKDSSGMSFKEFRNSSTY
jgi:YesN/AraC family two-component response regulator